MAGKDARRDGPISTRTLEGWFWFPPASERAFGTIEIQPGDLRLKLRDSARAQDSWRDMAVIHGESLVDGKDLTLLGAFVTSRKDFLTYGHNVEEFRFNALLIGAHVLDESELVFDRAIVHLRGLREWMSARWRGSGALDFRELVGEPVLEVAVEGASIKFGYERQAHPAAFRDSVDYDAAADIELAEPQPLDEWREQWLRPLLDLLVFATREQVVIESFKAIISDRRLAEAVHPAIRRAASDDFWARHDVEVVRPHVVDVRPRGIRPFQHMLLPLAALGERAPEALGRYFAIHRQLGRTAAFLFVVLNTRTILEENRLLNLMAFSEGYHRTFHDEPPLPEDVHQQLKGEMLAAIDEQYRGVYDSPLNYANQQTQRQRLKFLIARAAAALPALADPKNVFGNALVETRNQYTHQGEPGPKVIPDAELYEHVERFIEVLEVNLLLDLGLGADEIRALHAQAHPA